MFSAADEKRVLDLVPRGIFVNGSWKDSADKKTLDVIDPATGKVLVSIADAAPEDGMAAIEAAHNAQAAWAKTAPRERAEILRAAFEKVTAMADEFALVMSLEMGKPFAEAKGEVAYGAEFLRWFSEEAPRITGRYGTAPDGKNRIMVLKKPVGPSFDFNVVRKGLGRHWFTKWSYQRCPDHKTRFGYWADNQGRKTS
jgi:succinate-semialdehyde dehydrogenase/glutarate-semialdehyde dehydrogenase